MSMKTSDPEAIVSLYNTAMCRLRFLSCRYIFLWFSGTLFWQNAFLWLVALVAVLSTTLTVLLSAHVDGNYMDGNYIYLP